MISAFFSGSGRTDATHAALMLAQAQEAAGRPTTLVRMTVPGEMSLPEPSEARAGPLVVQGQAETAMDLAMVVDGNVAAALPAGRHVVLDLPTIALSHETLRSRIDAVVIPVGATPLDERAAALTLADRHHMTSAERRASQDGAVSDHAPAPPWLLGCGRSGGGPAARAFARSMSAAMAEANGPTARVLPTTLPLVGREESAALVAGDPRPWTLRAGLLLMTALDLVRTTPFASEIGTDALAAALGSSETSAIMRDERDAGERLRDLADELQAIRDGVKPSAEDLADAPLLENWEFETRPVRVLAGRVYGHPSIADGRRVTSSDLYASDGACWGRTLSRYYRLGTPADPASSRLQ